MIRMIIKRYFILFLCSLTIILATSSCATILYGTSSPVTIESEKGRVDSVSIIAVGPKEVLEIKNISLPYVIDIKHNNLPLRVKIDSNNDVFDPFTIGAKHKGEYLSEATRFFGYIGSAVSLGVFALLAATTHVDVATVAGTGLPLLVSGTSLAIGYTAETDLPDNKFYLTSSYPITSSNSYEKEDWCKRLADISDVYTLLNNGQYLLSEAKAKWLYHQIPTAELLYLKGISNYYLKNYSHALEDLKDALTLIDRESNPGLRTQILDCIETVESSKALLKAERDQRWSNIALGLVQAGSMVIQQYAQAKQIVTWNSFGTSTNGVIQNQSIILVNPMFALGQVQQQDWMEYTEFCRYNRKADGSLYSHDEWWAIKGQAINDLKEQGYDLLAEQKEQYKKNKEEMEQNWEQDRARRLESYGANGGETTTTALTDTHLNKTTDNHVANAGDKISPSKDNSNDSFDAKQQYRIDPVNSGDYKRIKSVTLYYRDGDKPRVKMQNVDLCRKGAYYFIRIGETYYPRCSSNWQQFRNAIAYGQQQLYFND